MNSIQSLIVRTLIKKTNMWNRPLPEIRMNLKAVKSKGIPEGVTTAEEFVDNVKCEVFSCHGETPGKAVAYFHGGGFCLGIYPSTREFAAEICKYTGLKVYLPDYRLAPENPYPAALEDAIAFFRGLIRKGFHTRDILVAGDSSGCALAVSALLQLKECRIGMPAALAFITPVFDLAGKGDTFVSRKSKDPFTMKDPLRIASIYTGGNNPRDPRLSPVYGELYGLPPVLIQAADFDVFLSDSLCFAQSLESFGGKVILRVWEKMWHLFPMQASIVPEAQKAFRELCGFLRLHAGIRQPE